MQEIKELKKPLLWLGIVTSLVWLAVFSWPDSQLRIFYCQVGQGDASLIVYQNTQILIDGGPDKSVLDCLDQHIPFYDRTIEMIILSHPQSDHYGGLVDVMERYTVGQFIAVSSANTPKSFQEVIRLVTSHGIPTLIPKTGDKYSAGSVQLTVLWPSAQYLAQSNSRVLGATSSDANDASVVIEMDFGRFCALFTGDIPAAKDADIAVNRTCQVLKVAHHGGKYSTSENFLQKIKPELAIISVGRNSYGHPAGEILQRLTELKIKILRTDIDGEIEIISDGENWQRQ